MAELLKEYQGASVCSRIIRRALAQAAALKPIYTTPSESAASEELGQFEQVWGDKYPLIVHSWRNNRTEIATFFKYPPEIRKTICTISSPSAWASPAILSAR